MQICKTLCVVMAAGIALAACASPGANREQIVAAPAAAVSDQQAFAVAKIAVLATLKDPESAKISEMRRVESNGVFFVCGRVNSKNGFGGYTGNKTFSVDSTGEALLAGESVNLSVWISPCWRELNR